MIDTHAHLDSCRESPDDLVAEAAAVGVDQILTIGREQAIDLARRFGGVRAVVGWHPHEAEVAKPETIVPLLDDPEVVAVGECGLDYFRDYAPRDDQLRVFAAQIEIANAAAKPLVIHTREADEDTFRLLEAARVPVVLHCFSSVAMTAEAIDRGYLCSFAGNVTYPANDDLRRAAAQLPADRILVETDAPYLTPVPHRKERNRPANVMLTLACVAEARGVSAAELGQTVVQNAERVFGR